MFGIVDDPKVPFEQLGNIATYVNGYAFKPSDWGTEGLPIIRIQNLSGSGDSFNYYSGEYPPAIEINKGDIMISWSATLGVFVWDGPKALLNQHIFKVYFDKIGVNPTYFRVAVGPALERSASKVHGSTMTHLTKKTFDSIMVPLPSIDQQNEFATFVEQVDKSKSLMKQCFQKYDQLVKSRFIEMIKTNNYPLKTIGESCITTRVGPFGSALHKTEMVPDGPVFVLGTDNAVDNEFKVYEERYITSDKYSELERYTVEPGDIIITMMGTIGRSAVIPNNFKTAIISSHLSCLSVDSSVVLPEYLQKCMVLDNDVSKHLDSNKKGSIMNGLNLKIIKAIPFSCPPLEVQKKFLEFVKQVDKSKFALLESMKRMMESV